MRLPGLLVLAVLALPVPAFADQQPDAKPITWKDCTPGGASTTPLTMPLIPSLRGFFIQNPSTASESLFFDTAKAASTTAGASPELIAGSSVTWGPATIFAGGISITAGTGGHAFTCQYGQ